MAVAVLCCCCCCSVVVVALLFFFFWKVRPHRRWPPPPPPPLPPPPPCRCPSFRAQVLVQQPLDSSDLAAYDEMVCQSLFKIEHIELEGVDEDLFDDLIFETFTCQLSHGAEVELCAGGAARDVTWNNRAEYCHLVQKARLKESRTQARAVLRGINSIMSVRLLSLFSHKELELMTCGTPEVGLATS